MSSDHNKLYPVTDLDQLDQLPIVLLTYESGSSGEFLAAAITHSFEQFYHNEYHWENNWRCMFQDSFERALSWGHTNIDHAMLLKKFNHLATLSMSVDQQFMVTVHPRPRSSIEFVQRYMPSRPMIKIACGNRLSKQFRKLSCHYKLNHWDRNINARLNLENEQGWITEFPNPGIEVEWQDIILDHPQREFKRIEMLLGQSGDWDVFSQMRHDYLARNQQILREISVDQ